MVTDKNKPSDELIHMVERIANTKDALPLRYRGLLNIGGVYYQARTLRSGRRVYMAGGKFIPKLEFIEECDGSVNVRKYKAGDWESAVKLAYEKAREFNEFIISDMLEQHKAEEQEKRRQKIHYYEKWTQDKPQDFIAWSQLARSYLKDGRYKDMENAFKKALEVEIDPLDCKHLGMCYLDALLNSFRGKKTPILGDALSSITADSLGYTLEEVRTLAQKYLGKACELYKNAGYYSEGTIKELELAYKAAEECSDKAFDEYEKFKAEQETKQMEERLQGLKVEPENDENT